MRMVSDPPMQNKVDVDTNKIGRTVFAAQVVRKMQLMQGKILKRKGFR